MMERMSKPMPKKKTKPIQLLIDGYNLMFQSIVSKDTLKAADALRSARNQMLDQLTRLIESELLDRTMIIFDASNAPSGLPDRMEHGQMRVVFARDWDSADELMQEEIRRHASPKQLTVVSSDHSIQRKATARGATVLDSEAWFERQLDRRTHAAQSTDARDESEADTERNRTLSEIEKMEWLDKFKH
jgi:uncharacterized protein